MLAKVTGADGNHSNIGIDDLNETFKEMFDLSLTEFIETEESELEKKLTTINHSHLDKIIDLFFEIIQRKEIDGLELGFESTMISKRTFFLIDYLDRTTKTFSIKRMGIKNRLG
ncbi:MAG: hypothetical protein ACPGSD_14170 [Flavobacteriales bacterium]